MPSLIYPFTDIMYSVVHKLIFYFKTHLIHLAHTCTHARDDDRHLIPILLNAFVRIFIVTT